MRPMPDYRNGGPFTRHMNFGHIAATASAAMTGRAFLLRKCPEPLVFLSGLHSPPAHASANDGIAFKSTDTSPRPTPLLALRSIEM